MALDLTSSFQVIDARFRKLALPYIHVERLYTGCRWAEGPVWFGDGRFLAWSDIPNNRLLRWSEETGAVSTFRGPSGFSNGNTRDRAGRLITCEHDRRVTRTEYDGSVTVLLERFEGKRLNAPNDVAVYKDNSVWFTDPGYGILGDYEGTRAEFELPTRVYRLEPGTHQATVVLEDLERPNGLCFSPDFTKLYVTDTGSDPKRIMVYDVIDGTRLENGRDFCDLGTATTDGLRCDTAGRLWCSVGWGDPNEDGVRCYMPDGDLLGKIHIPETVANLCFGGMQRNRLYICGSSSLYGVYTSAQGAMKP